jgi:hypothetical protein
MIRAIITPLSPFSLRHYAAAVHYFDYADYYAATIEAAIIITLTLPDATPDYYATPHHCRGGACRRRCFAPIACLFRRCYAIPPRCHIIFFRHFRH